MGRSRGLETESEKRILGIFRCLDPAARSFLGRSTPDEAMDARDSPEFESHWLKHYEAIESAVKAAHDDSVVKSVEEAVFKRVFAYYRHPELAGDVADDVALLVAHAREDCETPWIRNLLEHYASGRFPRGRLRRLPKAREGPDRDTAR